MVLEEIGVILEMFKNTFPLSILFFVPIVILISPVNTAHEITAFRMQQYDLHGTHHGKSYKFINVNTTLTVKP